MPGGKRSGGRPCKKHRAGRPSKTTANPLTRAQIEDLSNILCACRRSGLDAANSLHIINRYLTSYCCKGGKSSANWERASRSLIEAYCSKTANADKSIRSVVSKLMLEVSGSMSIPRDQAHFIAAKGLLKRSSHGLILKCSVTSANIQELVQAANEQGPTGNETSDNAADPKLQNSFTMKNIFKRYKNRNGELAGKSLYKYCAGYWKEGTPAVPYFFGYHKRPTWPMSETFAKWTLILHCPWNSSPDETKRGHDNHVDALVAYLSTEDCRVPNDIWNEILRVKRKENEVSVDETAAVSGVDGDIAGVGLPTDNRTDDRLQDAAAATVAPHASDREQDFEDIQERLLHSLRKPPEDHN